jgi:endonuclease-8
MPEGHTLHRLADELNAAFAGQRVRVGSPQGRFADSAALIDGQTLVGADAWGKKLFVEFAGDRFVYVHLGLIGGFVVHHDVPEVPLPVGEVRLRITTASSYADLRGATACELVTREQRDAAVAKLGPDPLRADGDPDRAWERIRRSRLPIGRLLMDQTVLAGVGNVYRAELLFRHRMHPLRPGNTLRPGQWRAMWDDLVGLMHRNDRHRQARAHPGGHGSGGKGGRPRRRGVCLPPYWTALSCLRPTGADRGAGHQEPLLVLAMSAKVPLPSRRVTSSPDSQQRPPP